MQASHYCCFCQHENGLTVAGKAVFPNTNVNVDGWMESFFYSWRITYIPASRLFKGVGQYDFYYNHIILRQ